jgi:hypothetical protein
LIPTCFPPRSRAAGSHSTLKPEKEIRVTAELPGLDEKDVDITVEEGVLIVTLPKSEAANENVRRIPINARAA